MRLVFVVLDAFPNSLIERALTPNLYRLGRSGGRNRSGGVAEPTAATYPNHATFVTGVSTLEHGVMANRVRHGGKWIAAWMVGPQTTTLFDACRAEGRSTAVVVGDQNLIGVCGAAGADHHWPPGGLVPPGVALGQSGYIADAEVLRAVAALELRELDLLFVQIDEVDGVRHIHGPWGEAALEQCRRTDSALGSLIELLEPRWHDTVLVVVSDHDQEDVGSLSPVDFRSELPDRASVFYQGTAALVVGSVTGPALLRLPGVVGARSLDGEHHVLWGAPGQAFGTATAGRGDHGSPRTATQVAVVGGGHPEAAVLARKVEQARPPATAWAGWMAGCLGLSWRPGGRLDALGEGPQ